MNDLHNYSCEKGLFELLFQLFQLLFHCAKAVNCFFAVVLFHTRKDDNDAGSKAIKVCGGGIELSISISWNDLKGGLRAAQGMARQK